MGQVPIYNLLRQYCIFPSGQVLTVSPSLDNQSDDEYLWPGDPTTVFTGMASGFECYSMDLLLVMVRGVWRGLVRLCATALTVHQRSNWTHALQGLACIYPMPSTP